MAEAGSTANSTWMANLPQACYERPLSELAIPGSHDSFAYILDKKAPLAPDVQDSGIGKAANILKAPAKSVIYKWSLTQTYDFTQQLKAGIRYFDLRVSTRPNERDSDGLDELYLVHGMYGPKVEQALKEIKKFLEANPKEIIFVDFQHFYKMNDEHHEKCSMHIFNHFGKELLCPVDHKNTVTLKFMWDNNYQVILFYRKKHEITKLQFNNLFWHAQTIDSPWHNAPNIKILLDSLEKDYQKRVEDSKTSENQNEDQDRKFHVTQGILTPDAKLILRNATSTLKKKCGEAAAPGIVDWLKSKQCSSPGINICIIDYVEMADFIDTVINLNH